jgi:hypothetical protein
MYRDIAERTTGVPLDAAVGARTVVGIRGAYPGSFLWHGNRPDLFNDTLVLLWKDNARKKNVREFPANTDVGVYHFESSPSSSLTPNRRYYYVNGWHGVPPYNALQIAETDYRVRNDTNGNGHWDDDRNGWLPPDGEDYFREGSGHHIHVGAVDGPLAAARVDFWSSGCQLIPGMANWRAFIEQAWTGEGDEVSYFLVDARDIPSTVWSPCTPDGSRGCPFEITLPARIEGDTREASESVFHGYNCSTADESGPELLYVFTADRAGTLNAAVDCEPQVDIDIHLLSGADENACLARGHTSFAYDLTPGRYLMAADTYCDGKAQLAGRFTLELWWE